MVQALSRGMEILRLAAKSKGGIRLCDLADKMNLQRTTVFNLAKTLLDEGYLRKEGRNGYELGPALYALCREQRNPRRLQAMADCLSQFHQSHPETGMFYTELGANDINGKIYFKPGTDVEPQFPDDVTLPPYMTVCGLIFFAYAHDEQLNGLRTRHPFAFKGVETWGSEDKFQQAVKLTRQNGYAESPATPDHELKFGLPVFDAAGMLAGALTVSWYHLPREQFKRELCLKELQQLAVAMSKA